MSRVVLIALLLLSMTSCMPVKLEDGVQKLPNEHMKKCHGPGHQRGTVW